MDFPRPTADQAQHQNAKKKLFSNAGSSGGVEDYDQQSNSFQKYNQPRNTQTSPAPLITNQDDHFKAIDAVINSNADDRTKQRMIADIQENYRKSQAEIGRQTTEPIMYNNKARNLNKLNDEFPNIEKPSKRKKRINAGHHRTGSTVQEQSYDQRPIKLGEVPIHPSKKANKGAGNGGKQAKQSQKFLDNDNTAQQNHDQMIMPEVNEFIDDMLGDGPGSGKDRAYMTQDEMGDSRLAQIGYKPRVGDSGLTGYSDDDQVANKLAQITPGRIRASKLQGQRNNFVKSPTTTGTTLDFLNATPLNNKPRATTRPKNPRVENVDNQADDDEDGDDYTSLLPAVKVQKKKKKASPTSNSNRGVENSFLDAPNARNHPSTSRMSTSGMRRNEPKLRPTLDQSLHYIKANIKIPIKQTNFYDDKHHSAITDQQMKTWQIKNGAVILDEFHSGKKKIPVNRHRIPAVGDDHALNRPNGAPKPKLSPNAEYFWDMDGRKQKKPKKKAGQVITSNASLHKVDLPRINPNATNFLSPKGTISQPLGVGTAPTTVRPSIPGKFLNPSDKRLIVPPNQPSRMMPPELNTQSNNGPLSLIDIDIKPNQLDPQTTLHEPPIDYDDKNRPLQSPSPSLPPPNFNDPQFPDYECPVCLVMVKGRDTAPHSRVCRTARCRFCEKEKPLAELENHEKHCNEPVRCRFCNLQFPRPDIDGHEATCNEPIRCRICRNEYPMHDLYPHELQCKGPAKCRGCLVEFPQQLVDRHEAQCPTPANCIFCKIVQPLNYLDEHEANCNSPAQCPGCKESFPRYDFPEHVEICTRPTSCKFCANEFYPLQIFSHEAVCNEPQLCSICNQEFPRKSLPSHEQRCQQEQNEKMDPPTQAYKEQIEKKRHQLQKKSTGKVLVEDDFVIPKDFRDPSQRINKSRGDGSNEARTNYSKSVKKLHSQESVGKPPKTAPMLSVQQQRSNDSHDKYVKSPRDRNQKSHPTVNDGINNSKNQKQSSKFKNQQPSVKNRSEKPSHQTQPHNTSPNRTIEQLSQIGHSQDQIGTNRSDLQPNDEQELIQKQSEVSPPHSIRIAENVNGAGAMSDIPLSNRQPLQPPADVAQMRSNHTSSRPPKSPTTVSGSRAAVRAQQKSTDQAKSQSNSKSPSRQQQKKQSNNEGNSAASPPRSRGILKDQSKRMSNSPDANLDDLQNQVESEAFKQAQLDDTNSAALISENRQKMDNSDDNRRMIASEGSVQPPKTIDDNNTQQDDSLVKRGNQSPVHNARYDIKSNNEKISGLDQSQDVVSNVKLSKQLKSSNNITGQAQLHNKSGGDKSRSSNHINEALNNQNKTVKSQNTTSQVRFAYGTGESFDNVDKRMISGLNQNAKVNSSQKLDSQAVIDYEQFSQNMQTNQSMNTKFKQATSQDRKLLEVQQQVSMPTSGVTGSPSQAAPNKILKNPTDHSTNYELNERDGGTRLATTQAGLRKKVSPAPSTSKKSVQRANTNDIRSRGSNASKAKISNGVFIAAEDRQSKSRSKSFGRSQTSNSPQVQRVMEKLTHHQVKIDQKTKLLINGSEVLSHKGIKGSIQKIGVSFGTGRHTSGRKLDLFKDINQQHNERIVPGQTLNSFEARAQSPQNQHREVVRMDAETQNYQPDVQSEGCDPILKSVKSQQISARVTQHNVCLSARTRTIGPEAHSIAVSAKPMSEVSVREQGDQITEGRFEPNKIDNCIGTGSELMENYLYKEREDFGTMTSPIIIGTKKPQMISALIQTEPMINELIACADEPKVAEQAHEPETNKLNEETGSQSSMLELPAMDQVCELVMQTVTEPSEVEDPYVDDWVESSLYRYAYHSHYEHMVKNRFISIETVKRPNMTSKMEGMTETQQYEYNLNPENLEILSQMECEYGQSALRHKSATYINQEMLQELCTKAKTTIEVMNQNMVRPDITDRILFSHYSEVTKKNVTKLLIRCHRLYDARVDAVRILKLVMEVDAMIQPKSNLWRIIQDNDRAKKLSETHDSIIQATLKKLSTVMMQIAVFQREHRLFKDEFKFNGVKYRNHICDIGKIIGGFLKLKNKPNPALQETGLLQQDHQEHTEQTERYSQWVEASLAEHGKLEAPDEELLKESLQESGGLQSSRRLKESRIDRALEKMREEQREKIELQQQDSARNEIMSMTNKSRMLEQMQLKTEKLQILQQNSSSYACQEETQFQKTVISDQMIERKLQSQTKRERVLREQEERLKRHEQGFTSPDFNDQAKNKKFYDQKLLQQQLNYDNELEDQTTVNHGPPITMNDLDHKNQGENNRYAGSQIQLSSYLGPHMQDSLMSAQTHIVPNKQQPVLVNGNYQQHQRQFQQISPEKYNFAPSDRDHAPGLGQAYDRPRVDVHNQERVAHRSLN